VRHAAANTIQIEAQADRLLQQRSRGLIKSEPPGRRLLEEPLAHQVPQHPVERVAIGARCGGELTDLRVSCCDVIGDPQCRRHVHAPRCREIAQRPEIHPVMMP